MAYNANDVAKLGHLASLTAKFKSELTALDTKYTGAEANVINTVKVNGNALTPDANKAVNIDLTNYALKSDIAGGVKVKGSVAAYSNLPLNAEVGDMYNITTAGGTDENGVPIKAGDNVVKTETGWDNFGGTIDISGKMDKVPGATAGNIAIFGDNGIIVDSGLKFASDADVAEMLATYFPTVSGGGE